MNTIYVITNHINGKQYVGKTSYLLEDRFRDHQKCAKSSRQCKRPLYNAICKYGEENFSIAPIEEVDDEHVDEREMFWIKKLGTYGVYNATKGGEGYTQLDPDEIVDLYQKLKSITEVKKVTSHSRKAISKCLHKAGIEVESSQTKNKRLCSISLYAVDQHGDIHHFNSRMDAARWIIEVTGSIQNPRSMVAHICDAANGKRHTAYGCTWFNCADEK